MTPDELLEAGRPFLDKILTPAGFVFARGTVDKGSGGRFVQAAYIRSTRQLSFSVRHELGLVAYVDGALRLAHEDYLRAIWSKAHKGQYPGFNTAPVQAFAALASDLEQFGGAFLDRDPAPFAKLCAWAADHPRPTGLQAL